MGLGASLFLIAVGAVLTFAVETSVEGLNLDVVGWILMGVGVVGLFASLVYWNSWGGFGGSRRSVAHTTERHIVDDTGATVVRHDEASY